MPTCVWIWHFRYFFRAGDLELFHGIINYKIKKLSNEISVRAAATSASGWNKDIRVIEVECDCTGDFKNGRCWCVKAYLSSNSHCHDKKSINSKYCKNT